MDIQSEDELQDTDFSEDNSENHDPKQSSKAPVKGSLKVFEWVVVKYDIKIKKFNSIFCWSNHNTPTNGPSTNGQVMIILTLVTLMILGYIG